ncbi:MAG: NAD(P)/FAD-dependent oxidoreductase [Candidatus Omnitrophota bacterium]|jgi:L-2-hydroxyglutarate oxidase LhgO
MEEISIVVIGAGAVGLAAARELSGASPDIFILEKNDSFGQETSSRNSEVIHAGIYYPPGTLKAKTCVEGRPLLYDFCASRKIPHRRIGKLIIATQERELAELEKLLSNARANGVTDILSLGPEDVKKLEPNVSALGGIFSPSTGIFDTHAYMSELAKEFTASGGGIAYGTCVTGIEKTLKGFTVTARDARGEEIKISARVVVNCAGLESDAVARMAGIDDKSYKLKYSKGDYFRVHNGKASLLSGLVYPVPGHNSGGLGVHATLDTGGGMKLGPDDAYVDKIDYTVDPGKKSAFYESVKDFLPFIELKDLEPDTSGIRPKLQGPREGFRDFIIADESARGLAGLINLVGIESPGLTASLSIAKLVRQLASEKMK